ncbi:hypothetical protein LY76DRAFT_195487 [Colletotrichum caudatum]|nr:hypothetical protein LY76DRAFT_195487 [Colletotrichum caudatum]
MYSRATDFLIEGNLFIQSLELFLSMISAISPPNDKSQVDVYARNGGLMATGAFADYFKEGSIVHRWRHGKIKQNCLLVQDDTGLASSTFVSKMIDSFELEKPSRQGERPKVAYFFCKPPVKSSPMPVTVTTVLAGLANMLLDNQWSHTHYVKDLQMRYGSRLKRAKGTPSEFGVLQEILQDLWPLWSSDSDDYTVIIIDRLEASVSDDGGFGVSDLLAFLGQLSSHGSGNIRLLLSGNLSVSVKSQLNASSVSVTLDFVDVAAAASLDKAMQTITNALSGSKSYRPPNLTTFDPSLMWFKYCKASRSWLQEANHGADAKLLWYRRSCSPTTASDIGLHIAFNKTWLKSSSQIQRRESYFSFSASSSLKKESNHPAQALWCTFIQLLRHTCDTELSLAQRLLRLSPEARESLKSICVAVDLSLQKTPQRVDARSQLCDDIGMLDKKDFLLVNEMLGSFIDSFASDKTEFVLVFDCMEVLRPREYTKFLKSIGEFRHGVRVLLCVNDAFDTKLNGGSKWESLLSKYDVVDESTERKDCIESFRFDKMHLRRDQIFDALPNTNKWLWENEQFKSWRKSGKILWIYGKAGTGKSVLAKSILRKLQFERNSLNCQSPWFLCDWFYTARGGEVGMKHTAMLQALLFGILSKSESAFDSIKKHYRKLIESGGGKGHQNNFWPSESLQKLFTELSNCPSTPETIAIIDALDESQGARSFGSNSFDIFNMLDGLGLSLSRDSRIRFILLSRPEPEIAKRLARWPQINLAHHNKETIRVVVEDGIFKLRLAWPGIPSYLDPPSSPDEDLQTEIIRDVRTLFNENDDREYALEEIRAYLLGNADGVVLWARLVIDLLLRLVKVDGLKAISRTNLLRSIPDEIEDLYQKFIEDFRTSNSIEKVKDMSRILEWTIGCGGWTELQLQHLWRAIALPDNEQEYESHETISKHRFEFTSWDEFCSEIRRCCGPLIEILEDPQTDMGYPRNKAQPTWTVQLSHQTVRTFLRENSRLPELFVNPDSAERLVVTKLYRYLGIAMVPQSLELPLRSRSFAKKGPLESLEQAFSELPRRSFHERQLLAIHDYCKERPLAELALKAVQQSQADKHGFVDALHILEGTILSSKDCFPIYWATDMCFKPSYLGSNVAEFVYHCCLHGMHDALGHFFDLLENFGSAYSKPPFSSSFKTSRQHQIVRGAIEALVEVNSNDNNHQGCHFRVANSLHNLHVDIMVSGADNYSNSPIHSDDLRPDPPYLRSFDDFIIQSRSSVHQCTARCRHSTHKVKLPDGMLNNVHCTNFIQALETVVDRMIRDSKLWHGELSYCPLVLSPMTTCLPWSPMTTCLPGFTHVQDAYHTALELTQEQIQEEEQEEEQPYLEGLGLGFAQLDWPEFPYANIEQ